MKFQRSHLRSLKRLSECLQTVRYPSQGVIISWRLTSRVEFERPDETSVTGPMVVEAGSPLARRSTRKRGNRAGKRKLMRAGFQSNLSELARANAALFERRRLEEARQAEAQRREDPQVREGSSRSESLRVATLLRENPNYEVCRRCGRFRRIHRRCDSCDRSSFICVCIELRTIAEGEALYPPLYGRTGSRGRPRGRGRRA